MVPGGLLTPYARGGASSNALRVADVKAVVAISPAGGSLQAWGADGLRAITPRCCSSRATATGPSITQTGARAFFDMATNSKRYLLTFLRRRPPHRPRAGARRNAASPVGPRLVRGSGLAIRTAIVGINLHFITAFLDRYVKDDASRAGYLDGLTRRSERRRLAGFSRPSLRRVQSRRADGITVWKGFQREHAEGLGAAARVAALGPTAASARSRSRARGRKARRNCRRSPCR